MASSLSNNDHPHDDRNQKIQKLCVGDDKCGFPPRNVLIDINTVANLFRGTPLALLLSDVT